MEDAPASEEVVLHCVVFDVGNDAFVVFDTVAKAGECGFNGAFDGAVGASEVCLSGFGGTEGAFETF